MVLSGVSRLMSLHVPKESFAWFLPERGLAHSNSTIYAVEGKNVIILCPLWSTTSVVSWTGPQNVTYSINGVVNENILHSHKISVVGDKKKGEYNLLIERLLADDFGLYQCESMDKDLSDRVVEEVHAASVASA
ncbi:Hypothetical predicted protein [Mytilus galloprovincialis]|uniref:Ig-like domain-containing protein n=1 Tax=Mytilus galloprovincialis TaxID=29158 RepID=A0A8B6F510_MYTGA|nr:Hypothetical predicted protein [Mytilus galloprovincialis]